MTTNDVKLLKQSLRRREFRHEPVDPIQDAAVISDKVRKSSCFGAAVAILAAAGAVIGLAAMFGTSSYKASSGRIIQRRSNGRFRQTTLRDFGIAKSELTTGGMICNGCGYGENEYWRPILITGNCPKCGSKDKREAVQS